MMESENQKVPTPVGLHELKQEEEMENTVDADIDDDMDDLDEEESHGTGELNDGSEDGLETQHKTKHAITGRGVTLAMLMADGLIEPGEDVMSIEYLVR